MFFFKEYNMKFQNLLGMFAVLLIALSGPSYADSFGSIPTPSAPPASPPPTVFIHSIPTGVAIDPWVSELEVTESTCGGTVELCENKGKSEGDELAKFTINQILYFDLLHGNNISYKFYKIKNNVNFTNNKIDNKNNITTNITGHHNVKLNNNINIINNATKNINISNNNKKINNINNSININNDYNNNTKNSINYNININKDNNNDYNIINNSNIKINFPQLNQIVIKHSAYKLLYSIIIDKSKGGHWQIALNDNEKILVNGAAQRSEFALRVIKTRYTNAAKKSDCDDTCKAFNRAKSVEVGRYHEDLSIALERAGLSPLQRLIPVGDTVILTPTISFVPSIGSTAPRAVNTIANFSRTTIYKVPAAAKDEGISDAGENIAYPPAAAVTPKVPEPEGAEFNCGESADSCQQEGRNCGSILAQKVINQIVEMVLLDAEENGKDLEKDFPFVSRNKDFFSYLYLFVEHIDDDLFEPNRLVRSSENDKILMKSAAQSAEFSLRNIKARLSIAENNPNYDNKCQAYNRSKFMEVDGFHEDLSRALIGKNIPLL
jgi:hypothetical protein